MLFIKTRVAYQSESVIVVAPTLFHQEGEAKQIPIACILPVRIG